MESLDLTYKYIDRLNLRLKVKHLTKFTLCLKYFRNIVIVMTKGKNKKMKTAKFFFISATTPSLSGREGAVATPHPPTFFMAKIKIL